MTNPPSVVGTIEAPLRSLLVADLPDRSYALCDSIELVSPPNVSLNKEQIDWLGYDDHSDLLLAEWGLRLRYLADGETVSGEKKRLATEKIMLASAALWIVNPNFCGICTLLYYRSDAEDGNTVSVGRYSDSIQPLESQCTEELSESSINDLRVVVPRLLDSYKSDNAISRTMRYLLAGLRSTHLYPRYVMLSTVLECLLNSDSHETTHKLSERYAWIMAQDPSERKKLFRRIKKLYKTRSTIVHGSGVSKSARTELDSIVLQLEEAVQTCVKRVLLDGDLCNVFSGPDKDRRVFLDELPFG